MSSVKAAELRLGDVILNPITREAAGMVSDIREYDGRIWMNTDPELKLSSSFVYSKYTRFQLQNR